MGVIGSKRKEYNVENDSNEESIQKVVCKVGDLNDGEMREFDIGEGKVLLVKQNGIYSALSTKCTHYGASLCKGVLKNGTIRCPWHGACFNATTGDIEDYPGLDSLQCFEVTTNDGDVIVKVIPSALKSFKRSKPLEKFKPKKNFQIVVIIGGGAAAQSCLETLRQNGFSGKLILITKEKHTPYDRPKLSKALDSDAENLYLRNKDFYKNADVTVLTEAEVTSIDLKEGIVKCFKDSIHVKYDYLVFASGSTPVMLDVPGNKLKNVRLLRTPEDANYIADKAVGKDIVVVGSSFIAMEVVSYLLSKALSIKVICRSEVPFKTVFGEEIGMKIKKMFEEKGVVFYPNSEVTRFHGSNNILTHVQLSSKEMLKADICVVGIGVRPSVNYLKELDIKLTDKNLICVNEYMETSIKNFYACGDIVEFPLTVFDGMKTNISHWQMALSHGRIAALNILGKKVPLKSVPFFWSVMCGKSFRYTGLSGSFDDIIIDGSIVDLKFIAYYCQGDKVVGVCTVDRDPAAAKFASDVLAGAPPSKSDIAKFT